MSVIYEAYLHIYSILTCTGTCKTLVSWVRDKGRDAAGSGESVRGVSSLIIPHTTDDTAPARGLARKDLPS